MFQLSFLEASTLPRDYRDRPGERERGSEKLRRRERGQESETDEDEERDRMMDEGSEGEESDDTAYDRSHAIPPCELP